VVRQLIAAVCVDEAGAGSTGLGLFGDNSLLQMELADSCAPGGGVASKVPRRGAIGGGRGRRQMSYPQINAEVPEKNLV
jgi:hypothetical protein